MKSNDSQKRFSSIDLWLLLVAAIWGCNYVVVKVALKEMEPMLFTALRFATGAGVCWLVLLFKERDIKINRKQFRDLLLTGIIALGVNQIAFVYGTVKLTAGETSLILASAPAFVALLASVFKIEKINATTIIGVVISFLGVALITGSSGNMFTRGLEGMMGYILMIIASIFWSLYTIIIRIHSKELSIMKITAYSLTFASIFFIMITLKDILKMEVRDFSVEAWMGVLFSGIFVLGISYTLWNIGIQKVGAVRTAVYANLPPFISILFGGLVLGESIAILQIAGGLTIVLGLMYSNHGKESKAGRLLSDH